jgi:predicted permease
LITRIFLVIFPILAVAAAGYLYARFKRPDLAVANQLNMELFLPALIFHVMAAKTFDLKAYAPLAFGGLLVVIGSGLISLPIARLLHIQSKTLIPPMMFTNTGNLGLPLAVFAFGEPALPAAVMLFVVANTLQFTLGMYIMDPRMRLRQIIRIPMIIATLAGLIFSIGGWTLPKAVELPIEMLGQIAIPLMLFSLGVRMVDINVSEWNVGLLGGLLCPLSGIAVALILLSILPLVPVQRGLLLVFSALPPAVLNYIIAETYRQEPAKVASIVMLGNLLSLLVLPAVLAFALR